jgi:hypothetical protein
MSATRRLAAILAADVAGYLRLTGADEEGTLGRLKAPRRALPGQCLLKNLPLQPVAPMAWPKVPKMTAISVIPTKSRS